MPPLIFSVTIHTLPRGTDGSDRLRISVQSPVGEATADVLSPFTADDIRRLLAQISRDEAYAGITRAQQAEAARVAGAGTLGTAA